jgi:hypothetical protein
VGLDNRRPSTIDVISSPDVLWDSAIVAMPTVPVSLAGVPIAFRKRSRIPGRGSKSVLKGRSQLRRSERFNSPSGATPPPGGWNFRLGEGDSFLQKRFYWSDGHRKRRTRIGDVIAELDVLKRETLAALAQPIPHAPKAVRRRMVAPTASSAVNHLLR